MHVSHKHKWKCDKGRRNELFDLLYGACATSDVFVVLLNLVFSPGTSIVRSLLSIVYFCFQLLVVGYVSLTMGGGDGGSVYYYGLTLKVRTSVKGGGRRGTAAARTSTPHLLN